MLFRNRELAQFGTELGEFCGTKNSVVHFETQIKGHKALTEFSPMRAKNSLSWGFRTVLVETVFGPFPRSDNLSTTALRTEKNFMTLYEAQNTGQKVSCRKASQSENAVYDAS